VTALLLTHATATLAMTGVIWFVQLVHYPLFRYASEGSFADFSVAHQRRTSWVVVPLMLIELGCALVIAVRPPEGSRTLALVGLALLAVIWLSTALVQVPLHRRLSRGLEPRAIHSLVQTNWVRTAAWSARAAVALAFLSA
jgi:hypothetical protein